MKTEKLKFDHPFFKLYGQKTAKLIHIDRVSYSDLDPLMIEMDTQYSAIVPDKDKEHEEVTRREIRTCKLKKGGLVLLVFLGNKNIPFTTLRNGRDSTFRRYRDQVGDTFDIVVKGECGEQINTK